MEQRPAPTETVSYSDVLEAPADPESYNWGAYEKYMVAFLPVHNSVDGLIDMWKSNANMLDWAKKVAPESWQRIRDAFAKRKSAITGDRNGR